MGIVNSFKLELRFSKCLGFRKAKRWWYVVSSDDAAPRLIYIAASPTGCGVRVATRVNSNLHSPDLRPELVMNYAETVTDYIKERISKQAEPLRASASAH
jgi:hypothetical protein